MGWLRNLLSKIKNILKNKNQDEIKTENIPLFPCKIHGTFSTPSKESAIAARNISLLKHGHTVDYSQNDDNSCSNNTLLGGGIPYGGIWLAGSYYFEFDSNGQRIDDKSYIKVFSDEKYPVTGGCSLDGKIGMASPAGVTIQGNITGKTVNLCVSESGMSIEIGSDLWNSLLDKDKNSIEGNKFGNSIEYVHGNSIGIYEK